MTATAPGRFDGPRLTRQREAAGLSRADLAARVGTNVEVVGLWEDGGVTPVVKYLPRIADVVGLDVFDLYLDPAARLGLSSLRIRAGLSQRQLARRLGAPQTAVSNWERGKVSLPPDRYAPYSAALEVSLDLIRSAADASARVDLPTQENSEESSAARRDKQKVVEVSPADKEMSGRKLGAAHIVAVAEMTFENDQLVDNQIVRVYSPQGVDEKKSSTEDLDDIFDRAVEKLVRYGFRKWCGHHEARVIIDGKAMYAVRHQKGDADDDRWDESQNLMGILTPQFYPIGHPDTAETLSKKSKLRREIHDQLPGSDDQERLFIIARLTDTVGWLEDQVLPYCPYTVVVIGGSKWDYIPVLYDHTETRVAHRSVTFRALGVTRSTTMRELLDKMAHHSS